MVYQGEVRNDERMADKSSGGCDFTLCLDFSCPILLIENGQEKRRNKTGLYVAGHRAGRPDGLPSYQ